ncbi:uncharacterized protein LOC125242059 [Leguminivora glycinivorella]|uniref:uncharacterized protein LOC125242059 n=1 Tax=Leguminivora glycinivorella TaxID=1035111 RepID=UPI00200E14B5|nr:uncharacterized protein LOC125242059 [Leguminivora glycinivorella]
MNHLPAKLQRPPPRDLLYADDIALVSENAEDLQQILEQWRVALQEAGLRISKQNTEYVHCNFSCKNNSSTISLEGTPLNRVDSFKYLGSVVTNDATVDTDIIQRINTGWVKWKELSGVLCDKRMPVHIKGKIYKTAVSSNVWRRVLASQKTTRRLATCR